MGHASSEFSTTLCVARQPILDGTGQVFGYELLYRGAPNDTACSIESDLASARVITSAMLDLGLDTLTGGRPAFLNVTGALVLDKLDLLIPSDGVVVELLETIEITAELVEACRNLKAKGYQLALDDFIPGSAAEALLPHVSFVKVDVLSTPIDETVALAARLRPTGVTLLAEKVETLEVYERTRQAGYSLFQGYYFCKPVIRTGASIPARKMVYLRLLAALNKPDITTLELEALVKQDVSLSLRVLRFANSAAISSRAEIGTIREALFLIGMEPIRKWASVWCLAGLTKGSTPALPALALMRARSCELAGERLRGVEASDFFLVGLCSLLDVMLGRPMQEALASLPLSAAAAEALLGRENPPRAVLDAVIAYESGAWREAAVAVRRAGVAPAVLSDSYATALRWAQDMMLGITSPPP